MTRLRSGKGTVLPGDPKEHLAQHYALQGTMVIVRSGMGTALRRGVIEFCVLAVLEKGECYAVELIRMLSEALGMATSEGTIYPLLSRLRTAEKIDTVWRESPSGPPRRYYTLTPLGQAHLNAFRAEWSSFRDGVDYLLRAE